MTSSWDNLPNANIINSIISIEIDVDIAYDAWREAYVSDYRNDWDNKYDNVWLDAYEKLENAIDNDNYIKFNEILDKVIKYNSPGVVEEIMMITFITLVSCDDCGHLLQSAPDELKILAKLGDTRATLLLPICIVINKERISI